MARVVLDEGVPRQIAPLLRARGFDVSAFKLDWCGTTNGMLLALMEAEGFDILLTADQKMRYQQNLTARKLLLVVLPTNTRRRIEAEIDTVAGALSAAIRDRRMVLVTFSR